MPKRTINYLLLLFAVFFALSLLVASVSSSDTAATLSTLCSVVATIAGLIAWVGGLVKQARQRQWGWFVCTFLFGLLCLFIYQLVVPDGPTYRIYQPRADYRPGYQPQPQEDAPSYYQPPSSREEPTRYDAPQSEESASPQYMQQEMRQPESYQEAMNPEFYREDEQR